MRVSVAAILSVVGASMVAALVTAMTETTATAQRRMTVADFDAAQRRIAADRGQPVLRMSGPALPYSQAVDPTGGSAVFFWLRNDRLVYATPDSTAPEDVNARVIADVFDAPGRQLVALDRPAEKRIMRVVEQSASSRNAGVRPRIDDDGEGATYLAENRLADLSRQLKFATTLPVSSRFITLTSVLTRKFFLPTGMSAAQVSDWRSAFGFGRHIGALRDLLALSMARAHDRVPVPKHEDLLVAFLTAETTAMNTVAYRGVSTAATAFMAAEQLGEAWHGHERTDPILRHRAVLDGSVARLSTLIRNGALVHGVVSQPFKLREGEIIAMADDTTDARTEPASLVGTTCDESLMASVQPSTSTRSAARFAFIDAALAAGDSVLVTAKPFVGGGKKMGSPKRWTSRGGDGRAQRDEYGNYPKIVISRDVPLDVVLAGGPTE